MLFSLFLIILITFIPILIWGYIFSYMDNSSFNRKRFLFWVLAWWVSVYPIFYLDDIVSISWFNILNIFSYISNDINLYSLWLIFSSFLSFTVLLFILSFIFWIWFGSIFNKFREYIKLFSKIILVFLFLIFILILLVFGIDIVVNFFPFLQFDLNDSWIDYNWIAFNSFKLVILYYLVIWFIEELSKFFNFLQWNIFDITNIKKGVLYWIFIALWFSFIENIIYLQNIYTNAWFSNWLVFTYFFRSIFSVFLHIVCTSIISFYFTKAFLYYKNSSINFSFIKLFFKGLLLSILLHALFDISLTFWFTFVIFIYFIFWYIYITWIFYKE